MTLFRFPVATTLRKFSGASSPSAHGYKEKTITQVWFGDAGAYPVMSVIGFAVIFSLGWGVKVMMFSPDARIAKSSRTSILRGELKEVDK